MFVAAVRLSSLKAAHSACLWLVCSSSAAGLLRLMQTEDELAAVLAHEVSHTWK